MRQRYGLLVVSLLLEIPTVAFSKVRMFGQTGQIRLTGRR
jgi:hypothetical protein